jgi:beta-glucosidase
MRLEDCPAWTTYPGKNSKAYYAEGIFTGYRHYDKNKIMPLFPFGFGLSYTTFKYDNLKLSSAVMQSGETLQVSVEVTNTGTLTGKEIVQLYVGETKAYLPRPVKELKNFCKVELQPGQTRTVTFTVTAQDLSFFDARARAWKSVPGVFEIFCGASSRQGLTVKFEYKK